MKLKKILVNIDEKYYTTTEDNYGKMVEIFKNPTQQEIKEVVPDPSGGGGLLGSMGQDEFRYLVDNDDLYVWSSEPAYLHQDLANDLGIGVINGEEGVWAGKGKYNRGNIKIKKANYIRDGKTDDMLLEGEFDWLEDYGFDIEKLKREFS